MSGNIFISYRRDDSAGSTGRIFDRLNYLKKYQIFIDVDAINFGEDFIEAIEKAVKKCHILIVIIGRYWLTITDENGARRLDNPHDFIRIELETAFQNKTRIIPVLVDKAKMPKLDDLPENIKPLIRRNAIEISHDQFTKDVNRLILAIQNTFVEIKDSEIEDEKRKYSQLIFSEPVQATYKTQQGMLTLIGEHITIDKKIIRAKLNGNTAPDGRYKIGFMWYVKVRDGLVVKTTFL